MKELKVNIKNALEVLKTAGTIDDIILVAVTSVIENAIDNFESDKVSQLSKVVTTVSGSSTLTDTITEVIKLYKNYEAENVTVINTIAKITNSSYSDVGKAVDGLINSAKNTMTTIQTAANNASGKTEATAEAAVTALADEFNSAKNTMTAIQTAANNASGKTEATAEAAVTALADEFNSAKNTMTAIQTAANNASGKTEATAEAAVTALADEFNSAKNTIETVIKTFKISCNDKTKLNSTAVNLTKQLYDELIWLKNMRNSLKNSVEDHFKNKISNVKSDEVKSDLTFCHDFGNFIKYAKLVLEN